MLGSYRTKIVQISGSGVVMAGEGWISGYTCNSSSSGTFALYDAASATGTVKIGVITPTAGATVLLPNVHFNTGCYVATTNTININFYTLEYGA